jgi:hypothetical protein
MRHLGCYKTAESFKKENFSEYTLGYFPTGLFHPPGGFITPAYSIPTDYLIRWRVHVLYVFTNAHEIAIKDACFYHPVSQFDRYDLPKI